MMPDAGYRGKMHVTVTGSVTGSGVRTDVVAADLELAMTRRWITGLARQPGINSP
jgi:hypothetical protein